MKKMIIAVLLIAAENFIPALTTQQDRNSFLARPRHDAPLCVDTAAANGLIMVVDERLDILPKICGLRKCVVSFRLDRVHHSRDVLAFVDRLLFKTRGKGLKLLLRRLLSGLTDNCRRIKTAAERRPDRHVTPQP